MAAPFRVEDEVAALEALARQSGVLPSPKAKQPAPRPQKAAPVAPTTVAPQPTRPPAPLRSAPVPKPPPVPKAPTVRKAPPVQQLTPEASWSAADSILQAQRSMGVPDRTPKPGPAPVIPEGPYGMDIFEADQERKRLEAESHRLRTNLLLNASSFTPEQRALDYQRLHGAPTGQPPAPGSINYRHERAKARLEDLTVANRLAQHPLAPKLVGLTRSIDEQEPALYQRREEVESRKAQLGRLKAGLDERRREIDVLKQQLAEASTPPSPLAGAFGARQDIDAVVRLQSEVAAKLKAYTNGYNAYLREGGVVRAEEKKLQADLGKLESVRSQYQAVRTQLKAADPNARAADLEQKKAGLEARRREIDVLKQQIARPQVGPSAKTPDMLQRELAAKTSAYEQDFAAYNKEAKAVGPGLRGPQIPPQELGARRGTMGRYYDVTVGRPGGVRSFRKDPVDWTGKFLQGMFTPAKDTTADEIANQFRGESGQTFPELPTIAPSGPRRQQQISEANAAVRLVDEFLRPARQRHIKLVGQEEQRTQKGLVGSPDFGGVGEATAARMVVRAGPEYAASAEEYLRAHDPQALLAFAEEKTGPLSDVQKKALLSRLAWDAYSFSRSKEVDDALGADIAIGIASELIGAGVVARLAKYAPGVKQAVGRGAAALGRVGKVATRVPGAGAIAGAGTAVAGAIGSAAGQVAGTKAGQAVGAAARWGGKTMKDLFAPQDIVQNMIAGGLQQSGAYAVTADDFDAQRALLEAWTGAIFGAGATPVFKGGMKALGGSLKGAFQASKWAVGKGWNLTRAGADHLRNASTRVKTPGEAAEALDEVLAGEVPGQPANPAYTEAKAAQQEPSSAGEPPAGTQPSSVPPTGAAPIPRPSVKTGTVSVRGGPRAQGLPPTPGTVSEPQAASAPPTAGAAGAVSELRLPEGAYIPPRTSVETLYRAAQFVASEGRADPKDIQRQFSEIGTDSEAQLVIAALSRLGVTEKLVPRKQFHKATMTPDEVDALFRQPGPAPTTGAARRSAPVPGTVPPAPASPVPGSTTSASPTSASDRRAAVIETLKRDWGHTDQQAKDQAVVLEALADSWAKDTARPADEFFATHFAEFRTEKTARGLEEALQRPEGQRPKAATQFVDDGRAILTALEKPDVTSFTHEIGHVVRRSLYRRKAEALGDSRTSIDADISVLEQWAGVKDGKWDVRAEEKWARAWERYWATGKAPVESLQDVFDRMKGWFLEIYGQIRGSSIDVRMSPAVRETMDRLVAGGRPEHAAKIRQLRKAAGLPSVEPAARPATGAGVVAEQPAPPAPEPVPAAAAPASGTRPDGRRQGEPIPRPGRPPSGRRPAPGRPNTAGEERLRKLLEEEEGGQGAEAEVRQAGPVPAEQRVPPEARPEGEAEVRAPRRGRGGQAARQKAAPEAPAEVAPASEAPFAGKRFAGVDADVLAKLAAKRKELMEVSEEGGVPLFQERESEAKNLSRQQLLVGIEIAETLLGVEQFRGFKEFYEALGDAVSPKILPYARSLYEAARYQPGSEKFRGSMSKPDEIDAFLARQAAPKPAPAPIPEPARPTARPVPGSEARPAPEAQTQARSEPDTRSARLPAELKHAKPGYKSIPLVFESDYDLAAYILAGTGTSKSHQKYVNWLEDNGFNLDSAVRRGEMIRVELKGYAAKATAGADKKYAPYTVKPLAVQVPSIPLGSRPASASSPEPVTGSVPKPWAALESEALAAIERGDFEKAAAQLEKASDLLSDHIDAERKAGRDVKALAEKNDRYYKALQGVKAKLTVRKMEPVTVPDNLRRDITFSDKPVRFSNDSDYAAYAAMLGGLSHDDRKALQGLLREAGWSARDIMQGADEVRQAIARANKAGTSEIRVPDTLAKSAAVPEQPVQRQAESKDAVAAKPPPAEKQTPTSEPAEPRDISGVKIHRGDWGVVRENPSIKHAVAISKARNYFTLWMAHRKSSGAWSWEYVGILPRDEAAARAAADQRVNDILSGTAKLAFYGDTAGINADEIALVANYLGDDVLHGTDHISVGDKQLGIGKKYPDVLVKDLFERDHDYAMWAADNLSGGDHARRVAKYLRLQPEYLATKEEQVLKAQADKAKQPEVVKEYTGDFSKRKMTIAVGEDGVEIGGKVFDYKEIIKDAARATEGEARFDRNKKVWIVDANTAAAVGEKLRGAGGDAAGPLDPAGSRAQDERSSALRSLLGEAPDQRRTGGAYRSLVSGSTSDLLRRGEAAGIPKNVIGEQIEDVGMVAQAYEDGKGMFLLASEPGAGKTYVLGAAIRELRSRGAKRVVYVTNNRGLIAQIKRDLADFDIGDVEFYTYNELGKVVDSLEEDGSQIDALVFDEAHRIKNLRSEVIDIKEEWQMKAGADMLPPSSAVARHGQNLIGQAKFTVLSTATPFENILEFGYLRNTGIFDDVPGGWWEFAKAHGAREKLFNAGTPKKQSNVIGLHFRQYPGSAVDLLAARDFLVKKGVFTSRATRLPEGAVDSRMVSVKVDKKWVTTYDRFTEAVEFRKDRSEDGAWNGLDTVALMWATNLRKRMLEASKVEFGIAEAKAAIARGRSPIIFVETRAETVLDIPALILKEKEYYRDLSQWQEAKALAAQMGGYVGPPPMRRDYIATARPGIAVTDAAKTHQLPPEGTVHVLADYMGVTGEEVIHILPTEDLVEKAFPGKASVYTGTPSDATAQKNLAAWRAANDRVLIATMEKGGTGLSLHDKVGDHPTTMIMVGLPWSATKVKQVAARNARYGLKSKAEIAWLFSEDIGFDRALAHRVGTRMTNMGAAVYGAPPAESSRLIDFDFEDDLFSQGSGTATGDQTVVLNDDVDPLGGDKENLKGELAGFRVGHRVTWGDQTGVVTGLTHRRLIVQEDGSPTAVFLDPVGAKLVPHFEAVTAQARVEPSSEPNPERQASRKIGEWVPPSKEVFEERRRKLERSREIDDEIDELLGKIRLLQEKARDAEGKGKTAAAGKKFRDEIKDISQKERELGSEKLRLLSEVERDFHSDVLASPEHYDEAQVLASKSKLFLEDTGQYSSPGPNSSKALELIREEMGLLGISDEFRNYTGGKSMFALNNLRRSPFLQDLNTYEDRLKGSVARTLRELDWDHRAWKRREEIPLNSSLRYEAESGNFHSQEEFDSFNKAVDALTEKRKSERAASDEKVKAREAQEAELRDENRRKLTDTFEKPNIRKGFLYGSHLAGPESRYITDAFVLIDSEKATVAGKKIIENIRNSPSISAPVREESAKKIIDRAVSESTREAFFLGYGNDSKGTDFAVFNLDGKPLLLNAQMLNFVNRVVGYDRVMGSDPLSPAVMMVGDDAVGVVMPIHPEVYPVNVAIGKPEGPLYQESKRPASPQEELRMTRNDQLNLLFQEAESERIAERYAQRGTPPYLLKENDFLKSADVRSQERKTYYSEDGTKIGSSREIPQAPHGYKVGQWKIDESPLNYGRQIEQLREVKLADIEIGEDSYAMGRGDDVDRYAQWLKEGREAPPIPLIETEDGRLRTIDGNRRTHAALKAGKGTILAWVSPYVPVPGKFASDGKPIRAGLTDELAVWHALNAGKQVPEEVKSRFPDLEKKYGKPSGTAPMVLFQEAERERGPVFYSHAESVVAGPKMPKRAPAADVVGLLKSNGVKPDDLKWSGLDDLLRENITPEMRASVLREGVPLFQDQEPPADTFTGLHNAIQDVRVARGMYATPEMGRVLSTRDAFDAGAAEFRKQGLTGAERLAVQIETDDLAVTGERVGLLTHGVRELERVVNTAYDQLAEAKKQGKSGDELKPFITSYSQASNRLQEYVDRVHRGVNTEWHNVGMALQILSGVDHGSYASVARKMAHVARRAPTAAEQAEVQKLTTEFSKATEDVLKAEAAANRELAEEMVEAERAAAARPASGRGSKPPAGPRPVPGSKPKSASELFRAVMGKASKVLFQGGPVDVFDADNLDHVAIVKALLGEAVVKYPDENLDEISERMIKWFEDNDVSITHEDIIKSLATVARQRTVSEAQKRKAALIGEAKRVANAQARIQGRAATGRKRAPSTHVDAPSSVQVIEQADRVKKQEAEANRLLDAWIRIQTEIADLEHQIRTGNVRPKVIKARKAATVEMENARARRKALQDQIDLMVKSKAPKDMIEYIVIGSQIPKALGASLDISAPGRQGWRLMLAHPRLSAEAFWVQMKALANEEAAAKTMNEILQSPHLAYHIKAGLSYSDTEEVFAHLPVFNLWKKYNPYHASNRAYGTYLHLIRFKAMEKLLGPAPERWSPHELKLMGRYVNTATGKGGGKDFAAAAKALGVLLYAPRWAWSHIDYPLLLGQTVIDPNISSDLKGKILGGYLRTFLGISGLLALAKFAGADVETDPLSSDFGKIVVGDTRIDLTGGGGQYVTLLARLWSGKTKSSYTGKETVLNSQQYGSRTTMDVIGESVRRKLAPIPGTALSLAMKSDPIGRPFGTADAITSLIGPMSAREIYNAVNKEEHDAEDMLVALNLLGLSTVRYGPEQIRWTVGKKTGLNRAQRHVVDKELFRLRKTVGPPRDTFRGTPKQGDVRAPDQLLGPYNERIAEVTYKALLDLFSDRGYQKADDATKGQMISYYLELMRSPFINQMRRGVIFNDWSKVKLPDPSAIIK